MNQLNNLFNPLFLRPISSAPFAPETELNSVSAHSVLLPLQSSGAISHYPLPINNTDADAPQILAYLTGMVELFCRSAELRQFTVSILNPAELQDNDLLTASRTISEWVQRRVRYLPDPNGSEYVISPLRLIQDIQERGATFGDCDDHVLLLNSMLETVGIPTRVIGVKLHDPSKYDHVISSFYVNGNWRDFDPCAKDGIQPVYRYRLVTL